MRSAVGGINWMSPTVPEPAPFFTDAEKVQALSNAMHAISQLRLVP